MVDFRPSEVVLDGGPPLAGTMGRFEIECCAAIVVHALAVGGDGWRPIGLAEIANATMIPKNAPQWVHRLGPFFNPDRWGLVESGFAEYNDDLETLELTSKALEAIRPWVRRKVQPDEP